MKYMSVCNVLNAMIHVYYAILMHWTVNNVKISQESPITTIIMSV